MRGSEGLRMLSMMRKSWESWKRTDGKGDRVHVCNGVRSDLRYPAGDGLGGVCGRMVSSRTAWRDAGGGR